MNARKLTPEQLAQRRATREENLRRRRAILAEAIARGGPELVHIHEAAALLGVSRVTFWKWRRKGIIPPVVEVAGVRGWPASVFRDLIQRSAA
jgi:predicted DNA-binding transcriptional regulator AlpA